MKGVLPRISVGTACCAVVIGLCVSSGCDRNVTAHSNADPELLASTRSVLLLGQEPDNAIGVLELREKLSKAKSTALREPTARDGTAPDPRAPQQFTVVGRIPDAQSASAAGVNSPWEPGQAQFLLVDAASGAEHAHEHPEGHDCPYCNAKTAETQATVQFLNESGQPIPLDARDLFQLNGGELVVVRGTAELIVGVLMIHADGIYVRR